MPRSLFSAEFGFPAQGVWSAPGRVNLIGEHTDYNGGSVLPIAVPRRTRVAAALTGDGLVCGVSRQFPGEGLEVAVADIAPGTPPGWGSYVAGVVWAMRRHLPEGTGVRIAVDGEVPVGSGLSSSASLTCAVALAVADLTGADLSGSDLVRVAHAAEHDLVGAPVGTMDQTAAICSRPGHAILLDTATGDIAHLPFAPDADGLALAVVDTGVRHAHASGEYRRRRRSCEEAVRRLDIAHLGGLDPDDLRHVATLLGDEVLVRRVRHVVTENARVRLASGAIAERRWQALGDLFVESHVSMRHDFEITCPEVDVVTDACMAVGALGARMTGGGFGGCVVALVRSDDLARLAAAAVDALRTRGLGDPDVFTVSATSGVRREDGDDAS